MSVTKAKQQPSEKVAVQIFRKLDTPKQFVALELLRRLYAVHQHDQRKYQHQDARFKKQDLKITQ